MVLDSTRERNLLSYFGTCGGRQLDLGQVSFYIEHTAASRRRADIDEQQLIFSQLGNFCLLFVFGLHTEETTKKEEIDFEF